MCEPPKKLVVECVSSEDLGGDRLPSTRPALLTRFRIKSTMFNEPEDFAGPPDDIELVAFTLTEEAPSFSRPTPAWEAIDSLDAKTEERSK
jgi:hypothetical protein